MTIHASLERGSKGAREQGREEERKAHPRSPSPLLYVSITDTGSGISPGNMAKLFEPLFTTKAKGIGLGLAVSKNLVEANGGSIEVASQEGEGSTFTIVLPSREVEA